VRSGRLDSAMLECLGAVQRLLEHFPDRGVIVGGIAVGLIAQPRATQDVDAVLMGLDEVADLIEAAEDLGFVPRIADPVQFARRSRVVLLRHEPTGVNVDISLGALPFENDMVRRRTCYKAEGLSLPLAIRRYRRDEGTRP